MALIQIENASLSYEGQAVIENFSISIRSGEYLCVVGENGSGKTTILKGLLGLKKLDKGKILFGDGLKSNQIGYLPQQTDFQKDFPASVREVVLSGTLGSCGFLPFYTKKNKQLAYEAMQKLEITNLAKKCYHDLSGGQQQRVLLARALCASKRLLILDEPVTGLDMTAANELYAVIDKLNKQENMTVIMISHDIQRVLAAAESVLHIGYGKTLFYGTCAQYKESSLYKGFTGGESHA